jgi:hypothetical protein
MVKINPGNFPGPKKALRSIVRFVVGFIPTWGRNPTNYRFQVNKSITSRCFRHKESRDASPVELKVQTLLDLRQLYPSQEGWRSRFADAQVMVTREMDDLCENCSQVTHLGEKGGFVAVIKGPVGVDGGIVRVTTIKTDILPEELRTKVEEGMLDLPGEEILLQIMDSLEEHH